MEKKRIQETNGRTLLFSPFLVFVLLLGFTLFAYRITQANLDRAEALQFENEVQKTFSLLHESLSVYENLVFAAKGFVEGSKKIERTEWETFGKDVDLIERYPGLSAIGYIERVAAGGKKAFLEEMRQEGFPDAAIYPEGEREEYWVVKFAEPLAGFETAIGFDMATEPARREAMARAVRSGNPSVTGRVELVGPRTDKTGFVIFAPFFSRDPTLLTEGERQAALRGFVTGLFKSRNIFEGIFERRSLAPAVQFEVFAEGALREEHLIYSPHARSRTLDPAFKPRFFTKKMLPVADEKWKVYFTADAALTGAGFEGRFPVLVLLLGIVLSFFSAFVVFSSLTTASRGRKLSSAREELAREKEAHARKELEETRKREEETKRLNEDLELRVMERTAEIEAFSYSVSHDLRSPLIAINGFANALVEDYGGTLDVEAKRYLKLISGNSANMGHLIDDLLAFSRLGRQVMKFSNHIEMKKLAQGVFEEVRKSCPARDITFQLGDLPPADGDSTMMRQVWVNLLSNAVKFTRERSKAVIEAGSYEKNGENVYYVRDNGAGFDMTYANKLFQVFQRLHSREQFEGTGVGLAIVQRVVSRHLGHVWAEGKEGEGATFYFSLPRGSRLRGDKAWATSMKSRSS